MNRSATRHRIALLLLGVFTVLAPLPASAHGVLKSSDPARGATLARPPQSLRLTFSERVEAGLAHITLVRNARDTIALSRLSAASGGTVLIAEVHGDAGAGDYVIVWHVTGADGHTIRGTIPFSVGTTAAPAGDTPGLAGQAGMPPLPAGNDGTEGMPLQEVSGEAAGGTYAADGLLQTVLRWLVFVATVAVIGAATTLLLLAPSLSRQGRGAFGQLFAARAAVVGLVAGGALVALDALRLLTQRAAVSDGATVVPVSTLLATSWGRAWALHVAGALLASVAFALARRRSLASLLLVPSLLALAFGAALSGHAAAVAAPLLPVVADALHVIAGGAWIGTLLIVVIVAMPHLRSDASTGLLMLQSFSRVAMIAAGTIVATGIISAGTHLWGAGAPWASGYGRVLLVKIGFFLLVIGLGARNQRALRGEYASRSNGPAILERRARVEIALALALLAVTAVLVATPPPVQPSP